VEADLLVAQRPSENGNRCGEAQPWPDISHPAFQIFCHSFPPRKAPLGVLISLLTQLDADQRADEPTDD
jgi:hypothetical protein